MRHHQLLVLMRHHQLLVLMRHHLLVLMWRHPHLHQAHHLLVLMRHHPHLLVLTWCHRLPNLHWGTSAVLFSWTATGST